MIFEKEGGIFQIHHETTKELGNVFIRFGEAAVIGAVASLFVQGFSPLASSISILGGFILVLLGLYFINKSHLEEQ
ncbi:MAG: hypothetical protein ONB46_20285 [candidate division KSB1 bacterium]|nr:hypothetical protein [candidate division KSB1 bacterium]MDZ7368163.1 hypothetical protein [candidate division KSB1 bacterium]MDZ7405946.1 hypothetical protein [candidate division KSB1 bacterium]